VTYLYYIMCHNLKPSKINDEDPLSIFFKKSQTFFCHMPVYKLLIFMVIYKWHTIVYGWWNISWSLISCTFATCSMQLNMFCNYNIVTNGSFFLFSTNGLKQQMEQAKNIWIPFSNNKLSKQKIIWILFWNIKLSNQTWFDTHLRQQIEQAKGFESRFEIIN
jgi:hypothetical protein